MTVRGKLILIVVASIVLTTSLGLTAIYIFSKKTVLQSETASLLVETERLIIPATDRFAQSKTKLNTLVFQLQKALATPQRPEELAEFDAITTVCPDGVIRNRKPPYDGTKQSGIFLPPNRHSGDQQKVEHLRIMKVIDLFGAAAHHRFENVYFLSVDKSEIAFDRNLPDYVFEMSADLDFSQTPWVQLGDPKTNPERSLRFTPPLYDPVWKSWMVSAILPFDLGDRWVGTVGEDMQLANVLAFMFETGTRYSGEQHFLMDTGGNYLLAGQWQAELEKDPAAFKARLTSMPELDALIRGANCHASAVLASQIQLNNRRYLALGSCLKHVQWRYVRLVPLDEMLASMQRLFRAMTLVILLMSAITGILISGVTSRTISKRMRLLSKAFTDFGATQEYPPAKLLEGTDEISTAAKAFGEMVTRLVAARAESARHVEELHAAEEKYRSLVNNSLSIIYTASPQGVLLFVSPSVTGLLGYAPGELTGKGFDFFIHEDDLSAFSDYLKQVAGQKPCEPDQAAASTGGNISFLKNVQSGVEYRTRMKDGELRWHRSVITPVFDESLNLQLFVGNAIDITDRREAEEALRRSEENLRITLNAIGDAVLETDADGRVTSMNPVAERMVGWKSSEARGRQLGDVFRVVHRLTREPLENAVTQVLASGTIASPAGEVLLRSQSGQQFLISHSAVPIRSPLGQLQGVVLVFRDITEEIALQENLRQSQKMDAIGQLAGGVAHDFNNALGAIVGAAEMLKLDQDEDSEQVEYADVILASAERAGELTRKLLTFSRKTDKALTAVHMSALIEGTVTFLRHTLDKRITLSMEDRAESSMVMGDDALLQSAVINLAVNASHAMPEGGVLTISLDTVFLDQAYCDHSPFELVPGAYLEVSVRDTGCGIPPEVLPHIFEPFFTTKARGKGTGLGLSTVYGTMREHHGAVTVCSTVGEGTVFALYLPLREDVHEPADMPSEDAPVGTGTVLVVDDEPLIRSTAEAQLRSLGYDVLLAKNGKECLEVYAENKTRIRAIILDIIMPVMGGGETLKRLKDLSDVPVLVASGFAKESEILKMKELKVSGFLRKPFRRRELATQLARILNTDISA